MSWFDTNKLAGSLNQLASKAKSIAETVVNEGLVIESDERERDEDGGERERVLREKVCFVVTFLRWSYGMMPS